MKIECSGPNGETFEAQTEHVNGGIYNQEYEQLEKQYAAIQKALETWCEAFKVKTS